MFMLSRVSRITLPTFIIKEQNPDLLGYRTFSTVTLSFLTGPGEVSHQAGRWASASPCRSFPPPGLLHHTRCWSSASALSHPCIFLFNRVLDQPQCALLFFFPFNVTQCWGQTSRYKALSFLATSAKSAPRILYPLQQGCQIYSLLSSCTEQPGTEVSWSLIPLRAIPQEAHLTHEITSMIYWRPDVTKAFAWHFSIQASSTLPQLLKFITPDISGPWPSFCKCCPAMCWWLLLVWSGVSPSEIHWMRTRLKAPGIRYFKIYLVLIFTFFSHYHIPNKYIPRNSEVCLLTNSLQIQISVTFHIFLRGS